MPSTVFPLLGMAIWRCARHSGIYYIFRQWLSVNTYSIHLFTQSTQLISVGIATGAGTSWLIPKTLIYILQIQLEPCLEILESLVVCVSKGQFLYLRCIEAMGGIFVWDAESLLECEYLGMSTKELLIAQWLVLNELKFRHKSSAGLTGSAGMANFASDILVYGVFCAWSDWNRTWETVIGSKPFTYSS